MKTKHSLLGMVFIQLVCLFYLTNELIVLNGHDYGLALTRLLDNHYSYLLSGFRILDYTASFCAGVFTFANPNSPALSLTQASTFLFGPQLGIQITFILASALGGVGVYWTVKQAADSIPAALISANIFMFSGFLTTRFAVGHLNFYTIALAPLIAALLLRSNHCLLHKNYLSFVFYASISALLTAHAIYGGVSGLALPFIFSIALIFLLGGGMKNNGFRVSMGWFAYLTLSLALSAPKIEASLSLFKAIGNRSMYSLPGFDFVGLLQYLMSALFWIPNTKATNDNLVLSQWWQGWHELYIGLTPIVLISLIAWFVYRRKSFEAFRPSNFGLLGTISIIAILLLPLIMNFHNEQLTALLKKIPILRDSSNMLRWSCLYVPAFSILAGYSLKNVKAFTPIGFACTVFITITVIGFQQMVITKNLVAKETFDPSKLLAGWATKPSDIPKISNLGILTKKQPDGSVRAIHAPQYDYVFLDGASNVTCYEPIFGYRLENFPVTSVSSGSIYQARGGRLNIVNPACYVYPEENNCKPGDLFKTGQKSELKHLINRQPMPAKISLARRISEWIALFTLAFIGLSTLVFIRNGRRRRF